MSDVFIDAKEGLINFEHFRDAFDSASLPMDLARATLGERFSQYERPPAHAEFVKFIKLSTLQSQPRLPAHQDVYDELVDFRAVRDFKLSGPLSVWGSPNIFERSPCVFLSHRWMSPEHPDPDGVNLRKLLDRFAEIAPQGRDAAGREIYLWIDFCCLPQRWRRPLLQDEAERLKSGLLSLPEIVKSCDLLIIDSPDYLDRVWCYTELFVWLCKLAEISSAQTVGPSSLIRSVLTNHLFTPSSPGGHGHQSDAAVVANLNFRGFGGSKDQLLQIYKPVGQYCFSAIDSAGYTLGAYDHEYVPELVGFMCDAWRILREKHCADPVDRELCLRVIVTALKFANTALWRP
jgi:hypothetical protein